MKCTSHISDTAGSHAHDYSRIFTVILLTALVVGGCSATVGPQPADDKKSTASGGAIAATATKVDGATAGTAATKSPSENVVQGLPRLLDLGAGKCIPCKMMAPILEELKGEYAGVFDVEFIDVWQQPEQAEKYGIEMIPTQIFFDASGKEVFRHAGFLSKKEILAKWKEIGVERTEQKDRQGV